MEGKRKGMRGEASLAMPVIQLRARLALQGVEVDNALWLLVAFL